MGWGLVVSFSRIVAKEEESVDLAIILLTKNIRHYRATGLVIHWIDAFGVLFNRFLSFLEGCLKGNES